MIWRQSADESFWVRQDGRYYVCRSLAFDRNPGGHWVYVAWFKSWQDANAEMLATPERLESFEQAVAVCSAHLRAARGASEVDPPSIPHSDPHSFGDPSQRDKAA